MRAAVVRRQTPPPSAFLPDLRSFPYWDSYEAPLDRGDLAMHDLYLALFAHHPPWANGLLRLRDTIVRPLGLKPAMPRDSRPIEIKSAYRPGDLIGRFVLFAQNDSELVAGADDRHLDFRVAVHKLADPARVVLSTVVRPHNRLGRTYLSAILPFHRFGIRMLLANAVTAGRL